jgi:hypothetical protein
MERGSQSSPERVPEEVRYDLDELREQSQLLLGVSPAALAGALIGERRKSLTLDEARDAVAEFMGRDEEKDPATVEAES